MPLDFTNVLQRINTAQTSPIQKKGYRSEHAEAIAKLMEFMGEKGRSERFGYWCGRTRGLKAYEILMLIERQRDAINPQRAFNAALKRRRELMKLK